MIEAYRGTNLQQAMTDFIRAETIARMPNQGQLLDQALLNEADVDLLMGQPNSAAKALGESKTLLVREYPDATLDAWRYAVWNTVDAKVLASMGDATAAALISDAQAVIQERFGNSGFYSLLAARRAAVVASELKRQPAPSPLR